jgi:hypothetical protein
MQRSVGLQPGVGRCGPGAGIWALGLAQSDAILGMCLSTQMCLGRVSQIPRSPTLNRLNFCPWMALTCPWSFTRTPRAQIGVIESSLTRKRRALWMCPSDSLMTALASLRGSSAARGRPGVPSQAFANGDTASPSNPRERRHGSG